MAALSRTSVRVSWLRIEMLQSTDYTLYGYIVYYSQEGQSEVRSVTVNSTVNNVVIEDLVSNAEYLFQVAAIIQLNLDLITGMRSLAVPCKLVCGNELSNIW